MILMAWYMMCEVVAEFSAEVPDLHTLLAQIPPVLDLCGAFFSVPAITECKNLFGFTYKGRFCDYKRLPQGFKHSKVFKHQ